MRILCVGSNDVIFHYFFVICSIIMETDEKGGNKVMKVEKCCNMCGKRMRIEAGIPKEDFVVLEKQWGFFSQKDGEIHQICLCEDCYDKWIRTFTIPPKVKETTEYLS